MLVKVKPDLWINPDRIEYLEFLNPKEINITLTTGYHLQCSTEAAAHLLSIVNTDAGQASGLASAVILPGETPRETDDGGVAVWRCNALLHYCANCNAFLSDLPHFCEQCGVHLTGIAEPGIIPDRIIAKPCGNVTPETFDHCDFCNAPRPDIAPAPLPGSLRCAYCHYVFSAPLNPSQSIYDLTNNAIAKHFRTTHPHHTIYVDKVPEPIQENTPEENVAVTNFLKDTDASIDW